jgi:hypothetical protein
MKTKLTVSIDEELVPKAKKYAASTGKSLSAVIEQFLRQATMKIEPTFSQKWLGKLKPANKKGDPRYNYLAKRYGL